MQKLISGGRRQGIMEAMKLAINRFLKRSGKPTWHAPHIGAKEQERAQRCIMSTHHRGDIRLPRAAPTMQQMSKRRYFDLVIFDEADHANSDD